MKMEFLQPKNYLTVNFTYTYPQSNPYLHKNSFVTETSRPYKTTHSLLNISLRNTTRIHADEQNLWNKKGIVIKQNNWPESYHVLNENGNVMIRNCRHLILTNQKFNEKFSYDNMTPPNTKSPESIAPLQTANSPKPVTSLTTINPSKPITPNKTKVTQSGCVSKKPNRYIEQCWHMLISAFSCVWKEDLVTLHEHYKNKQTNIHWYIYFRC